MNQWLTLAANVGVIAGLLFLAIEIRQNTNIAKVNAYRDNVQDIAQWREMITVNPDIARIYAVYVRDGREALDNDDSNRISGIVNNVIGSYENAWFAWRFDVIDDEQWERFREGACSHFRVARDNDLSLRFTTAGFRDYLDANCANAGD